MDIRKNFYSRGVVRHWSRLPWEVVESPFLEIFKRKAHAALGNVISGCAGAGLMVGLDDLRGLVQPSWFNDWGA